MSENYVDTHATRAVSRPCTCPGTPHGEDTADVRVRLGYGEIATMRAAGWTRSRGAVFSPEDSKVALIVLGVRRWNLVLPDGSERPLSQAQVELLDEETVDWLFRELSPAVARDPLPNPSADRSPAGRSESAGPTRTTKARPEPTST